MDINHLRLLSECLGHKWDVVILGRLDERPLRYMEIAGQVREIDGGLTEGVLSKSLKRLAANDLLRREPVGSHHVYNLTTLGREIMRALGRISNVNTDPPTDEPDAGSHQGR